LRAASVSGVCPTVGVGGLTTGGGESWISSKYGTASDNALFAEVVTAEGRAIRGAPDENADLFWAIRGGSGNFGAGIWQHEGERQAAAIRLLSAENLRLVRRFAHFL
jgi:hypothetical protein